MTQLAFVRHGQALAAENRCIGHTDVALSPAGAEAIRQLVVSEPQSANATPTRLVSSDLRRAAESARVISAAIGSPVKLDRRLREMSFGAWDGLPWSKIERDDSKRFKRWMEQWTVVAPPGGESAAGLAQRAAEWIIGTLAMATVDERIVIVSHAGWIRAALTHLLGRELANMFEIPVDYARATVVDVSPSSCVVVAANTTSLSPVRTRNEPPAVPDTDSRPSATPRNSR
jgi:2,3-bisphosphoglycerate-dependent phosphoglycerate mutase/probable phosphoglycerate mutase